MACPCSRCRLGEPSASQYAAVGTLGFSIDASFRFQLFLGSSSKPPRKRYYSRNASAWTLPRDRSLPEESYHYMLVTSMSLSLEILSASVIRLLLNLAPCTDQLTPACLGSLMLVASIAASSPARSLRSVALYSSAQQLGDLRYGRYCLGHTTPTRAKLCKCSLLNMPYLASFGPPVNHKLYFSIHRPSSEFDLLTFASILPDLLCPVYNRSIHLRRYLCLDITACNMA
jgi:hypothetical protein